MGGRQKWQGIVATYQGYSSDEGRKVAEKALALLDRGDKVASEEAEEILSLLASLVPDSLVDVQAELARRRVFYPGYLYYGASAEVRDEFIRSLRLADPAFVRHGHLLAALAWVGDQEVERLFRGWRHTPPAWSGKGSWRPEDYAKLAGWYLNASNERQNLYLSTCFALVPGDPPSTPSSPVIANLPNDAHCGWCSHNLVTLLDIDLCSPDLSFLGLLGERLRVVTCENCYLGTIYSNVDLTGGSKWRDDNVRPTYLTVGGNHFEWSKSALVLGEKRRTPIEAEVIVSRGYRGASQIGGHPAWVQHPEYPTCPGCHRSMPCIGQVGLEDIETWEGVVYAFLCADCLIAATNHQQT